MIMGTTFVWPIVLLAQQPPTVDGTYWLLLASRVLHILGAIILLGGLIHVRHVVRPAVPESSADALSGGKRSSWAKWIGIATFFLLVSGLINYYYIITAMQRMAKPYHMLAGIKILLSLVLFMLAALLAGKTALAERLREKFYVWLTVAVLVGVAIVILGGVLRTFPRTPKSINVEASRVVLVHSSTIQN
jgi:putative copper export protein